MREVSTYADALLVSACRRSKHRCCGIVEPQLAVDVVAYRLDARPSRRHGTKEGPGDVREHVAFTIPARLYKAEDVERQSLDWHLVCIEIRCIGNARIFHRRLEIEPRVASPHRPRQRAVCELVSTFRKRCQRICVDLFTTEQVRRACLFNEQF